MDFDSGPTGRKEEPFVEGKHINDTREGVFSYIDETPLFLPPIKDGTNIMMYVCGMIEVFPEPAFRFDQDPFPVARFLSFRFLGMMKKK